MSFWKRLFGIREPLRPEQIRTKFVEACRELPRPNIMASDMWQRFASLTFDCKGNALAAMKTIGLDERPVRQLAAGDPNCEVMGLSLLWLAVIYLTLARRRIVEYQAWQSGKTNPSWQACARQSIGLARLAVDYLGDSAAPIVESTVHKATPLQNLAFDPFSDSNNKPSYEYMVDSAYLPTELSILIRGILKGHDVSAEDVVEELRSLNGNGILTNHITA